MTKHPAALAILLALTSAVGLSSCDQASSLTEQEHIQRAKDFETRGDLKTSVIELKNAVQKNPNSAQARLLLGQVYLRLGQGAEAEKELRQAQSLGVGENAIKPQLAESLLLQGEFQRLLDEVPLTGRESAANKSRLLSMFGDAQTGLRRLKEACALYEDSLKVDDSNVTAHWGLANCAYAGGKVADAYGHIQTALRIDPDNSASWTLLGDLELAEKKPDAAEAAYSNALKRDPASVAALFKHASLMLSKGRTDAAQQDLDKMRKVAPEHYLGDFLQALLHFSAERTDPALEATLRALKARPDHVPAYLLLGILQYNKKSYGQAAKTLTQYLQVVPGNVDARKILAAIHLKTGEPEQALALLKPVLAARANDPQVFAIAAEAYMLLKDPEAATGLYERASDLVPADAALQTQLALSRMASGDTAKAIAELEGAASGDKPDSQPGFVLALHYLRADQPAKALETLARLEKTFPNDPSLHNMKGAAYGSMNDQANARRSFERARALAPDYFSAAHNLAQLDLAQGKPGDARKRYDAILAHDGRNVRALVAVAQLASREGKTDDYVSWLNKAAQADAKAIQPRQLLARHYIEHGQGEKALALAREVMAANPDSPAALSLLGKTQLSLGQNENAQSTFTRLVRDIPNSADAHYHLALAERALKRPDRARAALKEALERQPGHLPAHQTLIAVENEAGRTEEALRLARDLQTRLPRSPLGLSLEGDVHLAARSYAKAAEAFERANALAPSGVLAVKQHEALALSGAETGADAAIRGWLTRHPDDLVVHTYLARHYLLTGRDREAIAKYEWLLKRTPGDARLLNNLAWLYNKTGDPRAVRTAEEAYRVAPTNPAIQDTLGWMLVQRGDAARGRDLLAKATAKNASPTLRYHYAVALARTGDRAKARQELEDILKSSQPFAERPQAEALLKSLAIKRAEPA